MGDSDRGVGNGLDRAGLLLRQFSELVNVGSMMAPLFRYMQWHGSRTPDECYRLWIDPNEIDRLKLFPPDGVPVTGPEAISGRVGGLWDRLTIPVTNHYLYQSLQARLEGASWPETQLYSHPKYRGDPERAGKRVDKIERLIDSMERDGFQRHSTRVDRHNQRERRPPNEWVGDFYVGDEIIVGLGRTGRLIQLQNGRHRLAVAQHLDLDEIPVVLSLIHPAAADLIPESATALTERESE